MGRGVVAANFVIGLRIPKKLRWSFFHWLIHSEIFSSYPNNDNLEVDWLLLTQSVCDTIESLCEYFMTYSTLMVDMFLKRTRGLLPTVAYTGKLRRKRKPYLGFRYIKEWGFTCWSIWKGREIYHFGRLQNSPYFCVFKYARAVKQKVWNEAENRERDWREMEVSEKAKSLQHKHRSSARPYGEIYFRRAFWHVKLTTQWPDVILIGWYRIMLCGGGRLQ